MIDQERDELQNLLDDKTEMNIKLENQVRNYEEELHSLNQIKLESRSNILKKINWIKDNLGCNKQRVNCMKNTKNYNYLYKILIN